MELLLTSAAFPLIVALLKTICSTRRIRQTEALLYKKLSTFYLISSNAVICRLIEIFINIFYKGEFLELEKQTEICGKILEEIYHKNSNKLFLVQGNAHSGKTILVQKIIRELYTNKKYILSLSRRSKSVFYYDFSHITPNFFTELSNLISNYYFEDKIVFFDNVHKLNIQQINNLFQICLNNSQKAKYMVILSRDIRYILSNDIKNLIDEKVSTNCLICDNLDEFNANSICDDEYSNFIKYLNIENKSFYNDYVKLEMLYVYDIYRKRKSKFIFKLFNEIDNQSYSSSQLIQFAFICCASIFTGYFDIKQFKSWCKQTKCKSAIKHFLKSGLIIQFANIESDYYSLHEKAARSYVSYFCESVSGKALCEKIFYFLGNSYNDFNLKYRYFIPSRSMDKKAFDKVILHGDYGALFEDTQYLIKTFSLNEFEFCKELGMLYDRLGEYKLTEENIRMLYNASNDDCYLITLLHANHMALFDSKLINKYKRLLKSTDPYLKFASNYWKQHIYMHYGKWNLTEFIELSEELITNLEYISSKSYEGFHLMRRYYFDCLRIYYLQGELNYDTMNRILKKFVILSDLLEAKISDFKYYSYKFVYAHFIHYDLLFKKEVLCESISSNELRFVQTSGIGNLREQAVQYYYKAYEGMKKNKDKTADYVLLRICELDPAFALSNIFHRCNKSLELFSNDDYFDMISIYDDFKKEKGLRQGVQEYAAFAETYKVKFTLICQFCCPNITVDFNKQIDEYIANAKMYHDSYFVHGTNIYGKLRLDFYKSISEYVNGSHDYANLKRELERMNKICTENRFYREQKLITNILGQGKAIKPAYIKNIVTFYPIILQ